MSQLHTERDDNLGPDHILLLRHQIHKGVTKDGGEEKQFTLWTWLRLFFFFFNSALWWPLAKLTAARKDTVKWKVIHKVHQVDTDASRDPVTQAEYRWDVCPLYIQCTLPPGPTECSFPVSAPERQKQRFQAGANTLFCLLMRMERYQKGPVEFPD